MLNTIDYNNHGLLDFNVAFNNSGNNISTHSGNPGKQSLFLQHHAATNPNLLQQQHQQHQYMQMQHYQQSHIQQQQQQPHIGQSQLDFTNVQNGLNQNQYSQFYTNQSQANLTHNNNTHLLNHNHLEPHYLTMNTSQTISNKEMNNNNNNNNNTNAFIQYDYIKPSNETKKAAAFKPARSTSLNSLGYDTVLPGIVSKKEHLDEEYEEEEEEEDDEDEFDEEEEEDEFDDDENEEVDFKKISKRIKKDIDNENDYEIKHNCLTEDGAYMNTLFNSPSSLSSGSTIDLRTKSNNNTNSYQYTNLTNSCNVLGTNISLINEANGGLIDLKGVEAKFLKTEMSDEVESNLGKTHASHNGEFSQPGSKSSYASSSSSTSSLSNYNEQIKMNNQHPMNKMIFSYTQAGIMNDFDLVNLPLRELNKRLRSLPKQMAYNLKKRRRTLKNRKYAQNCRSKRLEQKSEMEVQNSKLKIEINRLKQMLDRAQKENLTLKSLTLKSATHCMSNMDNEGSCLKAEHNSIDDTKENNQNKSFMISAAVPNSAFQSTNNSLNSPLTPNTPTHLNSTFNMSSGSSQLSHLLSLPSSKSSDNVNNNNNNNNNSMNSQTSHIHFNNNNNHSQQSQSFSFSSKC